MLILRKVHQYMKPNGNFYSTTTKREAQTKCQTSYPLTPPPSSYKLSVTKNHPLESKTIFSSKSTFLEAKNFEPPGCHITQSFLKASLMCVLLKSCNKHFLSSYLYLLVLWF